MIPATLSGMGLEAGSNNDTINMLDELWPLNVIDPEKSKFPCCLVWTPLPVVSWLAPFIGHVGICREDGSILDFSGSNLVNVNDFAFGAVARYYQLDRRQVFLLVTLNLAWCFFNLTLLQISVGFFCILNY